MLEVPSARPLDPTVLEVLRLVGDVVAPSSCPYFLVGATARDILLFHVFGIPAMRATRDVDFAFALKDWEQFTSIRQRLIHTGKFSALDGAPHRLYFDTGTLKQGYPLDLIPFGPLEEIGHRIAWPPDKQVIMSVVGYQEALEAAVTVHAGPGCVAEVAALPNLAAMKLIAWSERWALQTKDAEDFYFLLQHYAQAGNEDRLYGEAFECLKDCDYDLDLAGAVLLAQDCRRVAGTGILENIRHVIESPTLLDRLLLHMAGRNLDSLERAGRYLGKFMQGLGRRSPL